MKKVVVSMDELVPASQEAEMTLAQVLEEAGIQLIEGNGCTGSGTCTKACQSRTLTLSGWSTANYTCDTSGNGIKLVPSASANCPTVEIPCNPA